MRRLYFTFVILVTLGCFMVYKSKKNQELFSKNITKDVEENSIIPVSKIYVNEGLYDPKVYIYNTHQKENYADDFLNFNPSVLDAAHTLRDYLEELNIQTYVENADFYDFLALNNWDFSKLYKVSRIYLEDTMKRYKNIKIYIDLHRDSIKHDLSTITINGKDYAKILFVVGLSHDNYKENLNVAKKLNSIITSKTNISRGILQKSSANANGIYNQDLNNKIVLIEIGGYQNKYSEVTNSLELLAQSIKEYLNE